MFMLEKLPREAVQAADEPMGEEWEREGGGRKRERRRGRGRRREVRG